MGHSLGKSLLCEDLQVHVTFLLTSHGAKFRTPKQNVKFVQCKKIFDDFFGSSSQCDFLYLFCMGMLDTVSLCLVHTWNSGISKMTFCVVMFFVLFAKTNFPIAESNLVIINLVNRTDKKIINFFTLKFSMTRTLGKSLSQVQLLHLHKVGWLWAWWIKGTGLLSPCIPAAAFCELTDQSSNF